jgi:hypothetical protein
MAGPVIRIVRAGRPGYLDWLDRQIDGTDNLDAALGVLRNPAISIAGPGRAMRSVGMSLLRRQATPGRRSRHRL